MKAILVHQFGGPEALKLEDVPTPRPASGQEDLQRSGQHNERGEESLAAMLRLLAGNDLSHLHQISHYIQILQSRGATKS